MDFDKSIENTLSQIQKVMSANCIVGEPIYTKNKILIPVSKTTLAFGVGVGNNNEENADMGGAGGGACIDPTSFIVIHEDIKGPEGIQIVPIIGKNPLEDLIYNVGKIMHEKVDTSKKSSNIQDTQDDEDNIDNIKAQIKED